MSVFIAVLWLALGAATMAGLWVARQAEVRTARLRAGRAGWRQPVSTPGQQAGWDEHVTTAQDVIRTDEADLAAWDAETREAEGIALVADAGYRAWYQHKAGSGETGEAA